MSLPDRVIDCHRAFRNLSSRFAESSAFSESRIQMTGNLAVILNRIYRQFQMWSDYFGAHRRTRRSLDNRLPQVSHLRSLMLQYLDILEHELVDVLALIHGLKVPWDVALITLPEEKYTLYEDKNELEHLITCINKSVKCVIRVCVVGWNRATYNDGGEAINIDLKALGPGDNKDDPIASTGTDVNDRGLEDLELEVELNKQKFGHAHFLTMTSMFNLGLKYREQGLLTSSVAMLDLVPEICELILGNSHPYVFLARYELGIAYKLDGQVTKAMQMLSFVSEGGWAPLGEDHPTRVASEQALEGLRMLQITADES
ncbi:hypothetical protein BKA66DRAFT_446072 [Pyrenochaeta sp. MPI-SDFR-AT-0127]|nr:hypothetical protein BKA66DRAFT_446072 [Pyrenochaeta sp. MPI-SDFR-AT-0127]